ncbi:MAG: hypothetical protein ACM3UZ_10305 [Acidobacteriota bacterium]
MKKLLLVALTVALTLVAICQVQAYVPIKVFVDDKEIKLAAPAQLVNGQIIMPVQSLTAELGLTTRWDQQSLVLFITTGSTESSATWPNKTGQIQIDGASEFKTAVINALSLLKQKSPDDYRAVCGLITRLKNNTSLKSIAASVGNEGVVYVNWPRFTASAAGLDENTRHLYLSSILLHEAAHLQTIPQSRNMGLNSNKAYVAPSRQLTALDIEAVAYVQQRIFLRKMGAPKALLDKTSLDKLVDNVYSQY